MARRARRPGRKTMKRKMYRKFGKKPVSKATRQTFRLNNLDPTVSFLNMRPPPKYNLTKCIPNTSLNYIASGSTNVGGSFVFDPSGQYGNTNPSGLGTAMPDWTNLSGLFDYYKVNFIKVHIWADTTGNLDTDPIVMWMRYNYEPNVSVPSLAGMLQLPKVIKKTFTSQRPRYTYVIKPKVEDNVYNTGLTATAGRALQNAPWIDVNNPAQLYGFQYFVDNTSASQTIRFEIEYNVSFKYNK